MLRAVGAGLAAFLLAQAVPPRDAVPRPASPATGTIRGRVVSASNGDPIRNARVSVSSFDRRIPPVLADRDGRFVLAGIPPGDYTIGATKAGFAKATLGDDDATRPSTAIHIGGGTIVNDVVLALTKGAAVSGTVIDTAGEPVAGASVMLEVAARRRGVTPPPVIGMTDEAGRYRIGSLPAGAAVVSVFADARSIVMTPDGGTSFYRGGARAARIYYPGGEKADVGEPLMLQPGDEKVGIDFVVSEDAPRPRRIEPPPRDSIVVAGRVMSRDGRPLAGAQVMLWSLGARDPAQTITDADGVYQFVLPPGFDGTVRLTALRTGYLRGVYTVHDPADRPDDVRVAAGRSAVDLDIALTQPAAIVGRIFDENGDPIEGALVRAMSVRSSGGRRALALVPAMSGTQRTDDLGRYRISALAPGEYAVFAATGQIVDTDVAVDLPGYATTFYPGTTAEAEAQAVSVRAAQEVIGVDITLARMRTARIAGQAFDADGEPVIGGIALRPTRRSGAALPFAHGARIEDDGHFEFDNIPPGEYVLQFARHRQGAWNEGQTASLFVTIADADVTDLDVHLTRGSTVAGRIVVDDGATIPHGEFDISAQVLDPDRSATFGPPSRARIGGELGFEMAGLQGPRRLRVRPPAGLALKAILLNGTDITDAVLEFGRPNQSLQNVEVVVTARVSAIDGVVVDARGRPARDVSVVAFPIDGSLRYAGSRFIAVRACDFDGRFQVDGLPPGDYYVAAFDRRDRPDGFDDVDALDAFVARAQRVTIGEGQRASISVRAPVR